MKRGKIEIIEDNHIRLELIEHRYGDLLRRVAEMERRIDHLEGLWQTRHGKQESGKQPVSSE